MIERTERPRAGRPGSDRPATGAPQPRYPSPAVPGGGRDGSGAGANSEGEAVAPCDAFALLGDETRMAVLRALRAARDPFAPSADDALSFSALRERVGVDDPGRFNYHLNRLVGRFVRRTDEGYALRADAVGLVDAVAAGATGGADDRRADADDPCPLCGAGVEVVYENPTLTVRCTECRGLCGVAPDGALLSSSTFPPPGLAGRDGQELWDALFVHLARRALGFLRGVCPGCSAPTTTAVDARPDRDGGGAREQRGTARPVTATTRCGTCTAEWRFPARVAALPHPEVVGFFHARGVDAGGGLTLEAYNRLLGAREVVRSTDPVELEVTVEVAGDVLAVTLDGSLSVVEVRS